MSTYEDTPGKELGDEELAEAALLFDLAMSKAKGPEEQFVVMELRLFQVLGDSWVDRAARIVPAALAGLNDDGEATAADVKRITSKLERGMAGWDKGVGPTLRSVVNEGYRLGKQVAWDRVTGRLKAIKPHDSPHVTPDMIAKAKDKLAVQASFDLEDERAMKAILRNQIHWIGDHYSTNMSLRIAELVRHQMLERGLGRKDAGKLLRKMLFGEFGVSPDERGLVRLPTAWRGNPAQYFEGLAANVVTTARNYGALQQFSQVGVTKFEVVNPLSERTCDRCKFMDGRTFTVRTAMTTMAKTVGAKTPEAARVAHPWAKNLGELQRADKAGKLEKMFPMPTYHFRCRCGVDITEDFELEF